MCNYCYHTRGRTKLATKCEHKDVLHYAKGVYHNCYNKNFNTTLKSKKITKHALAWNYFKYELNDDTFNIFSAILMIYETIYLISIKFSFII